ncbi:signal recognition particle-docking protein FtsY [candidate division WOR-3 bacterium]|nr:signal recognition particle-docking protein FtsY [candidate division WOR-3 bacterium]
MNLRKTLQKTRDNFSKKLRNLFGKRDPKALVDFENLLIESDFGVDTAVSLVGTLEKTTPENYLSSLKKELINILNVSVGGNDYTKPIVELYVGVNGVGKTTTIGKRGWTLHGEGKKVLLASGDTFRTGAVEQLSKWGERINSDVVQSGYGADPAAVCFDAVDAAVAREIDYVLIDTAGRLHTRNDLMEEMKKIKKVLKRKREDLPQETILVVDGTTGQNALQQAKQFNEAIGITGIALTKLDGTAKGGIVVSIVNDIGIPVKYIGIGEEKGDLIPFSAEDFVTAILEE